MKIRKSFCRLLLPALLCLGVAQEVCAQSAIYACGHIRRNRAKAIGELRKSGYTTAILFNVNVEADGTLTTDFDWANQRPAEAGGIICSDGQYVFAKYQPNYVNDIRTLLTQPTSISRIEICIGGWGNGSYGHIRDLIAAEGTGPESALYRNFKALKDAIPEIVAVNNDQEQDYDLASATAFHRMLAEIGYKTTIAPYMNRDYWRDLVGALNSDPGTCEIVYLQTYGGGAGNNPADWNVFGDIPMYIGFDCEASADIDEMQRRFTAWRDNSHVSGGFLWNYNSDARDLNEWATAINRIFPTVKADEVAATFYQNAEFGGYAVEMPQGSFTQAAMAVYGIRSKDISSIRIADGYSVTLYQGIRVNGPQQSWTESTPYVGDSWNDKACSVMIERIDDSGVSAVNADSRPTVTAGAGIIYFSGLNERAAIYDLQGRLVATVDSGTEAVAVAAGMYIVHTAAGTYRTVVR